MGDDGSQPGGEASGDGSDGDGGEGGDGGDGGGGDSPVVLDLTGKGIKLTPLTRSNTFFDTAGDGYQHLTAWAGVGNAVLFYDPSATGTLTRKEQFVFTELDPSATNDLQALEDLYDTSGNGSLDSSDTNFSKFYVSITNADGSQTVKTLAQAGVTSISLKANNVAQIFEDGSTIQGESSFTTSTGSGLVAAVSLKNQAAGYSVTSSTVTNADGTQTTDKILTQPTGGFAADRKLNTTTDGKTWTLTTLDAGGEVQSVQTSATTTNADGSTTEVLTNYLGGTISATDKSGKLGTSVSTTGAEKLNSTSTTVATSAGTTTTTILRDQLGGGWTTQKEVDIANADGSTSVTISALNPDATASDVLTTTVNANGLTRTVTDLVDGIAADNHTTTTTTVINADQTRTMTQMSKVGTTTASASTTQIRSG